MPGYSCQPGPVQGSRTDPGVKRGWGWAGQANGPQRAGSARSVDRARSAANLGAPSRQFWENNQDTEPPFSPGPAGSWFPGGLRARPQGRRGEGPGRAGAAGVSSPGLLSPFLPPHGPVAPLPTRGWSHQHGCPSPRACRICSGMRPSAHGGGARRARNGTEALPFGPLTFSRCQIYTGTQVAVRVAQWPCCVPPPNPPHPRSPGSRSLATSTSPRPEAPRRPPSSAPPQLHGSRGEGGRPKLTPSPQPSPPFAHHS